MITRKPPALMTPPFVWTAGSQRVTLPPKRHNASDQPAGETVITFRKRILCAITLCILASCSGKGALRPPPPELADVQCRLMSEGEFVSVRFRVIGVDKLDPMAKEAYLLDESTGEKFPIVRLQRIGRLAEFTVPGEKGVYNVLFRNREGKLKVGTRVSVVIGAARKENLQLQE